MEYIKIALLLYIACQLFYMNFKMSKQKETKKNNKKK